MSFALVAVNLGVHRLSSPCVASPEIKSDYLEQQKKRDEEETERRRKSDEDDERRRNSWTYKPGVGDILGSGIPGGYDMDFTTPL